jgi:hypothetical protein
LSVICSQEDRETTTTTGELTDGVVGDAGAVVEGDPFEGRTVCGKSGDGVVTETSTAGEVYLAETRADLAETE